MEPVPKSLTRSVQPIKNLFAEWEQVRTAFRTAIQPFMDDLDAVEKLDAGVSDLKARRETVKDMIERRAEADHDFSVLKTRYDNTRLRYNELHDREGRRTANISAFSKLYWACLLCIGLAEWLINYDTFFFFLGVPAIAAGTTIIMGVLLAFAAHEHGTLLKQWGVMFGEHQSKRDRFSHYRILAFATLALLLVVGTAGASRYEYAMHILIEMPSGNILGDDAKIDVNPMKDVTLSLLGNVAAWAVGVFLAYLCHDKNPEYMDAAYDARKAERAFAKARRPFADEIKTEEAKIEREINAAERSALVRSKDVNEQRAMLKQVESHEASVRKAMENALQQGIEQYRDALSQIAISQKGALQILQGDKVLTPYEYRALNLSDRDILRKLVS